MSISRLEPRGVRFAPSPTGRFHIGNLRTAWISERLARALGEPWIVRFEDIDGPRVLPGAQAQQLADMRRLGLSPDEIVVQSARRARHFAVFAEARKTGAVYACDCSRKTVQADLAGMASAPHGAPPSYAGRCRPMGGDAKTPDGNLGWRFRADDPSGRDDVLVGRGEGASAETFAPSYHWACAIDDFDGRYRLLVRAADLAAAAMHQRAIQIWLARAEKRDPAEAWPALFHTGLVVQDDGHRLEKRTKGATLDELAMTPDGLVRAFEASVRLPSAESLRALAVPGAALGEERALLLWRDLFPAGA